MKNNLYTPVETPEHHKCLLEPVLSAVPRFHYFLSCQSQLYRHECCKNSQDVHPSDIYAVPAFSSAVDAISSKWAKCTEAGSGDQSRSFSLTFVTTDVTSSELCPTSRHCSWQELCEPTEGGSSWTILLWSSCYPACNDYMKQVGFPG